MVYAANLRESQRVIIWRLIIKEFGTNIQHIYGVDIILYDMLSRLTSTSVYKYNPITKKAHCCSNELFITGRAENDGF